MNTRRHSKLARLGRTIFSATRICVAASLFSGCVLEAKYEVSNLTKRVHIVDTPTVAIVDNTDSIAGSVSLAENTAGVPVLITGKEGLNYKLTCVTNCAVVSGATGTLPISLSSPPIVRATSDGSFQVSVSTSDTTGGTSSEAGTSSSVANITSPVLTSFEKSNGVVDGLLNASDASANLAVATLVASDFTADDFAIATSTTTCDANVTYNLADIPTANNAAFVDGGTYKVCVRLNDAAGNIVYGGTSGGIEAAKAPPVFTSLDRANGATDGFINVADNAAALDAVALVGTGYSNANYVVAASGTTCNAALTYNLTSAPKTNNTAFADAGTYKVCVDIWNAGGNHLYGGSNDIAVDLVVPTVSVGAPSTASANSSSTITYSVTYSGASSHALTPAGVSLNVTSTAACSVAVNNGTTSTPTISLTNCTGNGTVGITIAATTATDAAGNGNAVSSASTTFNVVNPPTLVTAGDTTKTLLEDAGATAIALGSYTFGSAIQYVTVTPPTKGTLGAYPSVPSSGTGSVNYTPTSNLNGADSFTYKVCDSATGLNCAANVTVSITITAVNDAPTIAAITSQSTNEDTNTAAIAVTISDEDGPSQTCNSTYLAYTSTTTSVVAGTGAVTWGGTWPNCTATIAPVANANGTSTIGITASDGTATSVAQSFVLTVNAVNDAPNMAAVSDPQTTNEDTAKAVAFTIDDVDGPLTCSGASLTYTSDNAALVLNDGSAVAWSGTYPNCTGTISMVANAIGSANITFQVSDGTLTASRSFVLSVLAVNDAPTVAAIADKSTNEDTNTSAIAVTVSDVDGPSQTCNSTYLAYTSTTTSVVASSGAVTWGGSWPNCTATIAPVANASGASTIGITASDGTATSASQSFTLTVNAVNDAPTVAAISDTSTNEDTSTSAIAVTVLDIDGPAQTCDGTYLNYTSSSVSVVAPSGAVTWGGTWPNCTATIAPVANGNGTSTIGITASDGTLTSAAQSFVLTVTPVNDAPTISDVANQTTPMETALNGVAVTINDIDSTLVCGTSLTATSSNTTVLPDANISIGGTAPNCTVSMNPAAAQYGTSTITLTVRDGALAAQDTFVFRAARNWYQEAYIKAANNNMNDYFGTSVSLFGETLAVSATGEASNQTTITNGTSASADNSSVGSGAVYVYKRAGAAWTQESYIKAANSGGSDNFGASISLSGDALAVGATSEGSNQTTITNGTTASADNSLMWAGAVYIYKRSGSTWAQEAFVKAVNSSMLARFGRSLSLSDDTLVIGATGEGSNQATITNGTTASYDNSSSGAGAVYVYKRCSGTWAQEAYVKASNSSASDSFGISVSLSGDTLAIGATGEDSNQTTITNAATASADNSNATSGAVYVYKKTGALWAQEAYVKAANNNASDNFGNSLSLSGNTLAVGAYGEASNQTTISNGTTASADNSNATSGAVYVYKRTGSTWVQEAYIKAANNNAADKFGSLVSLSGNTLAVSTTAEASNQTTITNGTAASTDNSNGNSGAVYVYKRTGSTWVQESYVKAANSGVSDQFGYAVSLSGDTLAVGAYQEGSNQTTITNDSTASADNSNLGSGAVYVYRNIDRLFDPPQFAATSTDSTSFTVTWGSATLGTGNGTYKVVYGTSEPAANCTSGTVAYTGTSTSTTVSSGVIAGNTYYIRICTTDGNTWSEGVITRVAVKGSSTAPTITSINRGGATNPVPFGTAPIDYVVTFSASMVGLSWTHFTLTEAGTATGASGEIDSIDCTAGSSCTVWVVPVNAGNLRLDLSSSSGVTDVWGNALATTHTGDEFYTLIGGNGWYQEAYLKAANNDNSDYFGNRLSISGDTLAVGAQQEDSNQTTITNGVTASADNSNANSGAVYIYKRSGSTWVQEAYVKAINSNAGDYFGNAVSISGDTLAVAATAEASSQATITNGTTASADNSRISGAVYVYKRSGSTWSQEAYVKAANSDLNDAFGVSVSLSGDTLAVDACGEASNETTITNGTTASANNSISNAGAVYVYKRTSGTWIQEAYIKAANSNASDNFGRWVSLSGDTLAAGALSEASNQTTITNGTTASADNSNGSSGAVYVYRRTGSIWVQEAYVKAANSNTLDVLGTSVSLSGDTLTAGASYEASNQTTITNGTAASGDNSNFRSGAVYIYKRTGTTWAQEAYVKAANSNASDYYGSSVSLAGNTLAVGAHQESSKQSIILNGSNASADNSHLNSGAAYVYKRNGTIWAQEAYIKAANNNANDNFGDKVSLSGDTLAVGAYFESSNQTTITSGTTASADNSNLKSGAVYVYRNIGRLFDPDIRVSAKTQTSITFAWGANLGTSTTIKVASAAANTGTPAADCTDGGAITLSAGDTSYTYSGLTAGTKYGFRFCAWDGSNASGGTTIWEETLP